MTNVIIKTILTPKKSMSHGRMKTRFPEQTPNIARLEMKIVNEMKLDSDLHLLQINEVVKNTMIAGIRAFSILLR